MQLNKIYLGDCLEVMQGIPDQSVDMVLCDPPQGITKCGWDSVIPLIPLWSQLKRVIKPNSAIILMANQPFTSILISSNLKLFKYCWVWEKSRPSNFTTAKYVPMKYTEDICVFYKSTPTYIPKMWESGKKNHNNAYLSHSKILDYRRLGTGNTSSLKYPRNIIKVKSISPSKSMHPNQKPVELMEYLIRTYTNKLDIILDFAAGSGTTAIACINTGRNFIGIEKDEEYWKIANERISNVST